MRIAALVLGILGGIAATLLGINWLGDYYQNQETLNQAAALGLGGLTKSILISAWFLAPALLLGVGGGILAMKGRGKIGGALMLIPVVGGAIQPLSLIFTFLLILAAVFAFVSKPKQAKVPPHAMQPVGA
jgi:hypothetical protein